MMRAWMLVFPLALAALVGCSSGGGDGCDTDDGMPLATSAWPKFRKDLANTGRSDATIAAIPVERWVFPCNAPPFVNAATSPVLLNDDEGEKVVVIAGQPDFPTVNRAYLINPNTGAEQGSFNIPLSSTASVSPGSTPLVSAARIVIVFTDDQVRQFELNGDFINSLSASGNVSGSPSIDHEGTIYTAAATGTYSTLCASGGARFLATIGSSEASPALFEGDDPLDTDDDVSLIGSNDANVRAFNFDGDLLWTFSTTAAVRASVVYDADNTLVYGVDSSGLVFALDAVDGRRCRNLTFKIGGTSDVAVIASPAFGNDRLYVVDTTGVLHAFAVTAACDTTSTATPSADLVERWTYASNAPVSSSPALARSPGGQPAIVFGSDDGIVHAIVDDGDSASILWTHPLSEGGAFGRSSAAIGGDGTVYVTTEAGRLFAIGTEGTSVPCAIPADATPSASPSPSPTAARSPPAQL